MNTADYLREQSELRARIRAKRQQDRRRANLIIGAATAILIGITGATAMSVYRQVSPKAPAEISPLRSHLTIEELEAVQEAMIQREWRKVEELK